MGILQVPCSNKIIVLSLLAVPRIGRKKALMAVVALHASSSIAVAWAPSFTVYVIIRFLTGVSISGMFLVLFVLSKCCYSSILLLQ